MEFIRPSEAPGARRSLGMTWTISPGWAAVTFSKQATTVVRSATERSSRPPMRSATFLMRPKRASCTSSIWSMAVISRPRTGHGVTLAVSEMNFGSSAPIWI